MPPSVENRDGTGMRIALVTREYPPETAWGGIGSFYASLARSLVEAGHQVEVFTQGISSPGVTMDDGVTVTRVLGLADAFGPPAGGPLAGNDDLGLFALGLGRALHRAVARRHTEAPFDVIEGHEHLGVNAMINCDGGIRALKVTRYHGAYHSLVKRGLVDWPSSTLVRALEAASIKRADLRISVSTTMDSVVTEDFGATPADVILPNFARAPEWTGSWQAKKDQVLFVGRLVLNLKRPDVAVEAFGRFAQERPGWKLVLVGLDQDQEGVGSVWAHLQASIPAELRNRIVHVGGQSQDEVYRLMAESKAMLMPSEFESFGMVAVEAMLHGCLPLVAAGTGAADVVGEPGLIRRRGSVEDFAAGLEAWLGMGDDATAASLSSRLVRHARSAFSEAHIIADTEAAFTARLAARTSRRPLPEGTGPDDRPLVSVVIPNLNGARFLDQTLRSVFSQDYPRLDVILADGGSTDDSLEIASAYPDLRVIQGEDLGQAHAVNRGLMQANGEILAFLNSDDLYRPGAVSAVVEQFRRRPEAMILSGGCDNIDETGRTVGALIQPVFTGLDGVIRYWGWGRWHAVPQPATFWRRELMEEVGLFDTSLHYAFDLEYWIRAAQRYPIVTVPDTLAAFRLVAGTKTVSHTDRMYAEERQVFLTYRSSLSFGRRFIASREANAHYAAKLIGLAEHLYLAENQRRRALELVAEAVRASPVRILDIRVWLFPVNRVAGLLGLPVLANKGHRFVLRHLPRPSRWGQA